MNTYTKIDCNDNLVEINENAFFALMKQQRYGDIVESALLKHSKKKIMFEMEYENIENLNNDILETIDFVLSVSNYQYSNKYKPELTTGKKQTLKKLNKLFEKEVA